MTGANMVKKVVNLVYTEKSAAIRKNINFLDDEKEFSKHKSTKNFLVCLKIYSSRR